MPPAVASESEVSASEEEIKHGRAGKSSAAKSRKSNVERELSDEPAEVIEVEDNEAANEEEGGNEEEEEGEDGEDEEVYVVEKILDHDFDYEDGQPRYQIKWLGYNKISDRTWEVKENLEGARELLEEYWKSIGGEPVAAGVRSGSKKRGRASTTNADADTPAKDPAPKKQKRGRRKKEELAEDPIIADEWEPPAALPGAWENEVVAIETIEGSEGDEKYAWLRWTSKDENDKWRGSKAKLSTVYIACPQRMLKFYENHLVFTDPNDTKKKNGR